MYIVYISHLPLWIYLLSLKSPKQQISLSDLSLLKKKDAQNNIRNIFIK